jgi:NAD/NADP transhydrogenase beta subunit
MLKIVMMVIYLIVGVIFLLGFIGDQNQSTKDKCLVGVIAMAVCGVATALLVP